jgi:polar amino acid transport system substrate-binding protein
MLRGLRTLVAVLTLIIAASSPCRAETIRIIAEDDWFPYSAKSEEGPKGIAVDLVKAAFAAEGIAIAFDVMNYDRAMATVKNGESLACFDAPRTIEIEKIYLWHAQPLFASEARYYSLTDRQPTITDIRQVAGKRVGLTQGYGYGNDIDSNTAMVKEYSRSDTTLVKKLLAERLDYIVLFDKVADYLLRQEDPAGKIKDMGHAASADIYLAFSKTYPDAQKYCDLFSSGLRKINSDGTYEKIWNDWDVKLKQ